jgi:mRNA interferase RelE/StbE
MSYVVVFSRRAEKEVLDLDASMFGRVKKAVDGLRENPRPPGVRKLKGRDSDWRVRVGSYRIVFSIDDSTKTVAVHRVTDRKDVYRSL